MKLDGNAVLYQLSREFKSVTCNKPLHSLNVDYPMLYDELIDMSGHVILVPGIERPHRGPHMQNVLCVCLDDASANAAEEDGLCVARVHDDVTFPHVYNRMQAVYVKNEHLDARLRSYVDDSSGYQPLLDDFAHTVGFACTLIDDQYRLVCASRFGGETGATLDGTPSPDALEADAIDLFMSSHQYEKMRESRKVFAVPGADDLFMKNVFCEDQLVGMLIMRHSGDMITARYVRFLLNYLAPFVEEMYERKGTLDTMPSRPARIRKALKSALEGSTEGAVLLERLLAEEEGEHSGTYGILRIERSFTHESTGNMDYFAQRLERAWTHLYCTGAEDGLYALVDMDVPDESVTPSDGIGLYHPKKLPAILRDNLAKAGMSRDFSDMRHVLAARMQADAAFAQGSETNPFFWLYRFDDYALDWLIEHGHGSTPPEYYCHAAITELARFDKAHGSELVHTLAAFMRNRYNATLAAQSLFVARSTLINRLERIVELTGVNLDDFDERLYLAISLKLVNR